MQNSIDDFRAKTGGDLSDDSVQDSSNSTFVYSDSNNGSMPALKRGLDLFFSRVEPALLERDVSTSINRTQGGSTTALSNNTTSAESKTTHVVYGIHGFVEQLTIPQANTFMTVFLFFTIAIAATLVLNLLFRAIVEAWVTHNSFPKMLKGFRTKYWGLLARTIVNSILIMYGVWSLLCVFEFTNGDSWGAKVLAGVTWAVFTFILGFFTFRIWDVVRRHKKLEEGASVLFEDRDTWRRYSLFYDGYKHGNISPLL